MRKVIVLFVFLALSGNSYSIEYASHCSSNEVAFFNCKVKGSKKIASLCGSEPKAAFKGHLQYRFGKTNNIEFKFPSTTNESDMLNKFNSSSGRTADFSLYDEEVSFINNDYAYRLYHEKNNQSGKWEESSVVMVWKLSDRSRVKTFSCENNDAGDNLSPEHIIEKNSSKEFNWHKKLW